MIGDRRRATPRILLVSSIVAVWLRPTSCGAMRESGGVGGSGGDASRDPGAPSVSLSPGRATARTATTWKTTPECRTSRRSRPLCTSTNTLSPIATIRRAHASYGNVSSNCIYAPPLRSALRCMSNPSCGRSGPAHESESGSLIRELASQAPGILDVAQFSLRSQKRFPKPAYL